MPDKILIPASYVQCSMLDVQDSKVDRQERGCVKDQPQKATCFSRASDFQDRMFRRTLLRLVFDTAALRRIITSSAFGKYSLFDVPSLNFAPQFLRPVLFRGGHEDL